MTIPRIRRSGPYALKYLGPDSNSKLRRIAQLSQRLSQLGVPTPKATYIEKAHLLKMPWLVGRSGKTLVLKVLSQAMSTTNENEIRHNLKALLTPLVKLHNVNPDNFELKPFDPWRKISSRLSSGSSEGKFFPPEAVQLEQHLRQRTAEVLHQRLSLKTSIVHGDFHAGQIFFGCAPRMSWVLDLDDLALGYRESDLGNFSAYLATARETTRNDVSVAYAYWASQVKAVYDDLSKRPLDHEVVDAYGAIALLRRGLKLWERHGDKQMFNNILNASRHIAGQ